MDQIGRLVFLAGLGLALLGALLWLGGSRGWLSWIGRLPGDIRIEGERGGFYFPLATCLLASLVLSGLLALFRRFFGG